MPECWPQYQDIFFTLTKLPHIIIVAHWPQSQDILFTVTQQPHILIVNIRSCNMFVFPCLQYLFIHLFMCNFLSIHLSACLYLLFSLCLFISLYLPLSYVCLALPLLSPSLSLSHTLTLTLICFKGKYSYLLPAKLKNVKNIVENSLLGRVRKITKIDKYWAAWRQCTGYHYRWCWRAPISRLGFPKLLFPIPFKVLKLRFHVITRHKRACSLHSIWDIPSLPRFQAFNSKLGPKCVPIQ